MEVSSLQEIRALKDEIRELNISVLHAAIAICTCINEQGDKYPGPDAQALEDVLVVRKDRFER